MSLYDRVRAVTPTLGTGPVIMGAAVSGYRPFSVVADGDTVSYVIEDGSAWEVGNGVWDAESSTLTRAVVTSSTGDLIGLSGGASAYITPHAADFVLTHDLALTGAATIDGTLATTGGATFGDKVGVGAAPTGAFGLLQISGDIGLKGNCIIRQSVAADGSTLTVLATRIAVGASNAESYSYAGGALLAAIGPSAGLRILDVGASSVAGHKLKVTNDPSGITGSMTYGTPTEPTLIANSSTRNLTLGSSFEQARLSVNSTTNQTLVFNAGTASGLMLLHLDAVGLTNEGPALVFSGSYRSDKATSPYASIKATLQGPGDGTTGPGRLSFRVTNNFVVMTPGVDLDQLGFRPAVDNAMALGGASNRWTTIYASTGSINTSDERAKQWRGGFTASELAAARAVQDEIGVYQWLDVIAEKGGDARYHSGVRAQRVNAIMQAHGLDPFAYGWSCYDAWEEEPEIWSKAIEAVMSDGDEPVEITPAKPAELLRPYRAAGDCYGIRPDELLFWLTAANHARLAALEAA